MAKINIPTFLGGHAKKAKKVAKVSRGRKRQRIVITYKGKDYSLRDLADIANVEYMTMYMRYYSADKSGRNYRSLLSDRVMGRPQ